MFKLSSLDVTHVALVNKFWDGERRVVIQGGPLASWYEEKYGRSGVDSMTSEFWASGLGPLNTSSSCSDIRRQQGDYLWSTDPERI